MARTEDAEVSSKVSGGSATVKKSRKNEPLQNQTAKGKVRMRRYLNGELHFCYGERDLTYTLLPERSKRNNQ